MIFCYKEEPHPSTMLRIGRVPGNLGASHYAELGEVHLKKTFTSMKVFKNFFILLYRNFESAKIYSDFLD